MSAAPSGRRKRPRSAASIFQGSRTSPHGRDGERRGSGSDSAYQIQRTLDDCKMVGTPGGLAVAFLPFPSSPGAGSGAVPPATLAIPITCSCTVF